MAMAMMVMVTAATTTTTAVAMAAAAAKKTKVVTHRQQSTKIGSGRNSGGGSSDGNSDGNGKDNDGGSDSNNDDDNDGGMGGGRRAMAATDSMVWGRHQAAETAEMGIKRKWEQCGYARLKFVISKIVTWVYFYSYPIAFPVY